MQTDLNKALLPEDSNPCTDKGRECYVKALGFDKNFENSIVAITVKPYFKEVKITVPFWAPNKKGDFDLCVAKALKQVIPNSAIYFENKPDVFIRYEINDVNINTDGLLIKRSKLISGLNSWFTEIYGKLYIKDKEFELNGAGAKSGILKLEDSYYTTWNACLDVANNIADVLVKENLLKSEDVKKAEVEK
jgi:hypothetical protein